MSDAEFAAELVRRLAEVLAPDPVRHDFSELLKQRVPASKETQDSPGVVCGDGTVSFLGFLNAICGPPFAEDPKKGLAALTRYVEDESGETTHIWLTRGEVPPEIIEAKRLGRTTGIPAPTDPKP